MSVRAPKQLIEVALPLDDINVASAREKSIRHGHPSTLHLWWARRPLATARAVLFAQLVNDPGGERGWYAGRTKAQADEERERLFDIIRDLVKWENTNNETVLERAREAIRASWRETCALNKGKPGFDPEKLPAFHDPFAGDGSIPLEAQRLGLEAHASDLNPVAVLINKAMIEIPPRFAGRAPVRPEVSETGKSEASQAQSFKREWKGAQGLAEDVRYYGQWMRDEAFKRIGHLYPPVEVTAEMANDPSNPRPDLKPYVGKKLTVIAWIWARTVKSPNPACAHVDIPLASTFLLSTKVGKEAYVAPVIENNGYKFTVRVDKPHDQEGTKQGTTAGKRNAFRCLISGAPVTYNHIRAEGKAGRMGARLMAVVAEDERGRVYLPPTDAIETIARAVKPEWSPETPLNGKCRVNVANYGLDNFGDLFTSRQLVALTTFADLVAEVRKLVQRDALANHVPDDGRFLRDGGTEATAYAEAASSLFAFLVGRLADRCSTICSWDLRDGQGRKPGIRNVFSRQAIPMTWDYVEANPLSEIAASVKSAIMRVSEEELIAAPYRHGSKEKAEQFFLNGMTQAMHRLAEQAHPAFPVTIYYAFKQSEKEGVDGTTSAGWATFLAAVINAGLAVTGTWPMRTELGNRMIGMGSNALASSIVLVCRKRHLEAPSISRRDFQRELRDEMPDALETMIGGKLGASPIAPVDLAQAAIGPGMAIYSKYTAVLEADGTPMPVHNALVMINKAVEDFLNPNGAGFDADTLFCSAWFDQFGWGTGKFGEADTLARAKGTSVDGVAHSGVVESGGGNVRLLRWDEYPRDWDPTQDNRTPVWEAIHQIIRALNQQDESAAGALLARMPERGDQIRQLAYHLYTLCERKKWADDARAYNELIAAWHGIVTASHETGHIDSQTVLDL